jgi:uncharacterized protein YggE
MKKILLALLILPCLSFAEEKLTPTLQSLGSCTKKHSADEVKVSSQISELAKDYDLSVNQAQKRYKDVSQKLKNLKVEFNSNLSIQEEFSYENNTQVLKGIRTNIQLEILTSPELLNQVLKILNSDKVKISGLSHQLSESLKQDLTSACIIEASKVAKKQAQSLAKGLEVELDRVINTSFSSSGNNSPIVPVYRSMKMSESSVEMENNQVDIRVEVSVTFSLK